MTDPEAPPEPESPPPVSPRPVTNQVDGQVPYRAPGAPFPPPSNRPVEWSRWVPEVRLLEAPRIALSPVIVALAFAGLLIAAAGDWALARAFDAEPSVPFPRDARGPRGIEFSPAGLFRSPTNGLLFAPLEPAIGGVRGALALDGWGAALRGFARLLWAVAVWGFFGTAICRCAAVRFAVGASGSPTAAVRLAGAKWVSSLGGPLLPASGLAALALGLILLGWAGDLPAAGPWIVTVLWGAALLAGLAGVLLLVLGAVGWPLMLAALAVEGSDAFDAFSRAFSYVLGRPLRLACHVAVGVVIAAVAVGLAQAAAVGAASLAAGFASVGMGVEEFADLGLASPEAPHAHAAGVVGDLWQSLWFALPAAYAAGLFWTLATVSYFLLRYADDAVDTDELWQPGGDESADDAEVPRVGVAASDLPTIPRPHRPSV